jgi:hypothetical protein
MFNTFAFQAVDSVQSAKKQFVSTFVQNDKIKDAFNGFIDAQASYTKDAITAGSVAVTKVTETFTDRTPYVEATKKVSDFLAPFFPTADCAKPSKKAK